MLTSSISIRLDRDRRTYACSNESGATSPASNPRTLRSKGYLDDALAEEAQASSAHATDARKLTGRHRGGVEPPSRWAAARDTAGRITAAPTDEGSTSAASPYRQASPGQQPK
jgi:hypothetical protein